MAGLRWLELETVDAVRFQGAVLRRPSIRLCPLPTSEPDSDACSPSSAPAQLQGLALAPWLPYLSAVGEGIPAVLRAHEMILGRAQRSLAEGSVSIQGILFFPGGD